MVYSPVMQVYSLYIHIPFCKHICSYCDFNTYAGLETLIPQYVEALKKECAMLHSSYGKPPAIHSIYFGGGTPTILSLEEFRKILTSIEKYFILQPDVEVSCEANPVSIDKAYLLGLHKMGINRLSIGMQSADPFILNLLGREHAYRDVCRSVESARQVGFKNINLDLIFGSPEQTFALWHDSLEKALRLDPEHLSLYSLMLEDETPLSENISRGAISQIDPDLAAEMYEFATDMLAAEGFKQYEISSWARGSEAGEFQMCIHNLQYWRNWPYLGIGAGAHGFAGGMRIANVIHPKEFIQRIASSDSHPFPRTSASETIIPIDQETEMKETLLMGLRLTEEGVSTQDFYQRFGSTLTSVFSQETKDFIESGLLEIVDSNGERIRFTTKGRILANQVFERFV